MRPTDRHGAGGGGRAEARVADGGPPQDAAVGRRRPHDPRHRARQPPPRGDGDGGGRHRLRGRADRGAARGARAASRGGHRDRLQPEGGGVEQLLLAVERARALRARRAAVQRRHRAPARGRGAAAGRPRPRGGRAGARRREDARRGGDEGPPERRRAAARDQQGARPGRGGGRVHRAHADRAGGRPRSWPRRCRRPGSATRSSTTRTASRSTPIAAGASGSRSVGGLEWVEVDDQRDLDKAREVAWRC